MRKEMTLVTGAAGEMGQALIEALAETENIIALDVKPLPPAIDEMCDVTIVGDILDSDLLDRLVTEYAMPRMFHLAALLSTRAEYAPEAAHRVNVDGTLNLLKLATEQTSWLGKPVTFIFPSSVAVYGMPSLAAKAEAGAVREDDFLHPTTMYGCNKLYCERLGRYYGSYYRQLAASEGQGGIDFRSVRFPGLISAFTMPTGGTSDYGPEMLHHAAQSKPYPCFVRPDTRIPFMAMPDAVNALLGIAAAPRESLSTHVYNVTSFNPSAEEIYDIVRGYFPEAEVTFDPNLPRQNIVDTWPADQDDTLARRDWGWQPHYNEETAFAEYLIPNITARYEVE